jgi:hypothetical protein
MSNKKCTVEAELELLQHESFNYFLNETNPANGLVIDKTAAACGGRVLKEVGYEPSAFVWVDKAGRGSCL